MAVLQVDKPAAYASVTPPGRVAVKGVLGPTGSEFAVEIKPELDDASGSALEDGHLGQALDCHTSRLPLGGLLVLDLTVQDGLTPHVADLLWTAHRRLATGEIMRAALPGVVLVNPPPPSQVTARASLRIVAGQDRP